MKSLPRSFKKVLYVTDVCFLIDKFVDDAHQKFESFIRHVNSFFNIFIHMFILHSNKARWLHLIILIYGYYLNKTQQEKYSYILNEYYLFFLFLIPPIVNRFILFFIREKEKREERKILSPIAHVIVCL
jgi:hypothetical protein